MTSLVFTSAGCVVFPDIEPESEEELYPPEIIISQVYPELGGVIEVEGDTEVCVNMKFELGQVRDRNISDVLYVRWYLNWIGPGSRDGELKDTYFAPSASEIRSSGENRALWQKVDIVRFPPELDAHTITVVVADRALDDNAATAFPEEDDEGQYVIWQWPVVLVDGGLCEEYRE